MRHRITTWHARKRYSDQPGIESLGIIGAVEVLLFGLEQRTGGLVAVDDVLLGLRQRPRRRTGDRKSGGLGTADR